MWFGDVDGEAQAAVVAVPIWSTLSAGASAAVGTAFGSGAAWVAVLRATEGERSGWFRTSFSQAVVDARWAPATVVQPGTALEPIQRIIHAPHHYVTIAAPLGTYSTAV
jgi:hypothetical protein